VFILIVGRLVNVAVPFIFADLVFVLEQGVTSPPWLFLFGYVGLRFFQSSGGLPAVRDVRRTCFLFFPTC
jgi:ATP-binding cassette subfamily B (MDR/TAP) protein 6